MKVILASTSPRRKELLQREGIDFIIDASSITEYLAGAPWAVYSINILLVLSMPTTFMFLTFILHSFELLPDCPFPIIVNAVIAPTAIREGELMSETSVEWSKFLELQWLPQIFKSYLYRYNTDQQD